MSESTKWYCTSCIFVFGCVFSAKMAALEQVSILGLRVVLSREPVGFGDFFSMVIPVCWF